MIHLEYWKELLVLSFDELLALVYFTVVFICDFSRFFDNCISTLDARKCSTYAHEHTHANGRLSTAHVI